MRNRHQFIMPPDPELHFEACSVILGAEISSPNQASLSPSWLWDLFMSAAEIANQAKLRPTKQLAEGRLSQLKINGKGNIFENCELEAALQQYMTAHTSMGHFPTDSELQQEACNVLNRTETASSHPSRRFLDFLMRLVWSSTVWLEPFRQRAETLVALANESVNDSYFLWGQTDTAVPLDASMELDMLQPWVENRSLSPEGVPEIPAISMHSTPESRALIRDKVRTQTPFFINDNNSYRRLKRELSRFVMTTMSPNNPNRHIPSDDELKYQARWILYDEYVSRYANFIANRTATILGTKPRSTTQSGYKSLSETLDFLLRYRTSTHISSNRLALNRNVKVENVHRYAESRARVGNVDYSGDGAADGRAGE